MAVLDVHRQLVNEAILSLGIQPSICQQADDPNLWKLHRGGTQVLLAAQTSTNHVNDEVPTLTIMAPILRLPEGFERLEAVYAFLLEANHQLITESFSVSEGWVVLSTTYFLEDLSRSEVMHLLDALSFHAQSFAKTFTEEFGLERV